METTSVLPAIALALVAAEVVVTVADALHSGFRLSVSSVARPLIGISATVFCLLAIFSILESSTGTGLPTRVWLCLDVSRSMLAEDVTPNRLEHGKQVLLDLLQDLQGVEVAVVAFAGEAVLVCPFTLDHEFAQSALQELNPDTVAEGGSDLGVALSFLAAQPLPAGTADLVVLVSDGGHQEVVLPTSWQLPPGRILYVLGVGEPNQDAVIPLSSSGVLHDQRGRPVVTRLAEEHLQTIARAGDGVYVHAETGAFDPSAVFASIRTEESSVAAPARWVGADWLLLAAFTLAMLQRIPAGFTSRGR